MDEIGKERERTKQLVSAGKCGGAQNRGKIPATGNFAKVELLVGSGERCARANILLWVHRSNTIVYQSVVEN